MRRPTTGLHPLKVSGQVPWFAPTTRSQSEPLVGALSLVFVAAAPERRWPGSRKAWPDKAGPPCQGSGRQSPGGGYLQLVLHEPDGRVAAEPVRRPVGCGVAASGGAQPSDVARGGRAATLPPSRPRAQGCAASSRTRTPLLGCLASCFPRRQSPPSLASTPTPPPRLLPTGDRPPRSPLGHF